MRRAKIVATLGPSSQSVETIVDMIWAGLDVARINMSHGDHEYHKKTIENIRKASLVRKREVAILMDLQGPKIRVSSLDESLQLTTEEIWYLGPIGNQGEEKNFIPTNYENIVEDCEVGVRVLFDDGLIQAKVVEKEEKRLKIKILVGGELKQKKGINLPDSFVSAPSFTKKDKEDLLFGIENDIDYVALSFVRTAEDINKVKYLLHSMKLNIPVVSKIERPQAVDNIDEIIEVSDVIMVARGDMGVELGNHLVPRNQKMIINKCNAKGKPVITATQMLESMITQAVPTRAEASDVANAIWDGTDAVMLSGETASGKWPINVIKTMSEIVEEAEKIPKDRPLLRNVDFSSVGQSLQVAASLIAEKTDAKWIVSLTETGASCLNMSRFRPMKRVLGVTNSKKIIRKMTLFWGITPYYLNDLEEFVGNFSQLERIAIEEIRSEELIKNGDKIVITHGDGKVFIQNSSNSIRVEIIKDSPLLHSEENDIISKEWDKGKILLDTQICASCQTCIQTCPHDIWYIKDDEHATTSINENKVKNCTLDEECVESCPTGAIEIIVKDDNN